MIREIEAPRKPKLQCLGGTANQPDYKLSLSQALRTHFYSSSEPEAHEMNNLLKSDDIAYSTST